jgi:GNAT superfamily N-acetyltransferase
MVLDAHEASGPADRAEGEPVIVYKESPPGADGYMDLFETTGWNKVYKATAAELETALGRSWYCVAAYDCGSLVGFGRVLSDGVLYAMIYDVIVRPTHQHRGIGTAIVTRLVDKCVSEGLRAVQLSAAKNTAPFYHRHGFVERSPDAPGMRLVKPADSQGQGTQE